MYNVKFNSNVSDKSFSLELVIRTIPNTKGSRRVLLNLRDKSNKNVSTKIWLLSLLLSNINNMIKYSTSVISDVKFQ